MYFIVRDEFLRFLSKQNGFKIKNKLFLSRNLLHYWTYHLNAYNVYNIYVLNFWGWAPNAISLKRLSSSENAII